MINTLLEHVPVKMEVKDLDEARHKPVSDEMDNGMPNLDDKIQEIDDDDEEDEEEDDEEESDIESDALEIEQEAILLISSDEEAELEAQRIRFPEVAAKKLRRDSIESSRSSSRNSEASSNSFSKSHITYEIVPSRDTIVKETSQIQRISPRLKILESLNEEKNNNNNTTTTNTNGQTLLKQKTENKKFDNKSLENIKNKSDEVSKTTTDNHTNSENNRNIENLLKFPAANASGQKSRRASNNSTCSIASTVASENAETESVGNIYVIHLQQKLIFNCKFCDLKYGDLENFGRHLHEAHKLFNIDEGPEKENAPRNLRKSNRMLNNTSKHAANVKKEPMQCLELMAEPPVALPPSVLAEPLDSCGNVFMLNHRKLFLICGYCETKYANLELFEKHLRQQYGIFENSRNEVNVVSKLEVKEEVFIISEVADKCSTTTATAVAALPVDMPLNVSPTAENEKEPVTALEKPTEPAAKVNAENSSLETINEVTAVVNEKEHFVGDSVSATMEQNLILAELENSAKPSPKRTRSKKRPSAAAPAVSPKKRPKRVTRNNTKTEKESAMVNVKGNVTQMMAEVAQILGEQINVASLTKTEFRETRNSTKLAEPMKDALPVSTHMARESKESVKPIVAVKTIPLKPTESKKTKKTKQKKETEAKKLTTQNIEAPKLTAKAVDSKKQTLVEKVENKESRAKTAKSSEMKKIKQEKLETQTVTDRDKLKCSICQKEFSRKDTLKIHERTHTGEKPYECDVCRKSFGARANLYIHKKFHMDDSLKKFKCDICEKRFHRNSDCKVHMSSHPSERDIKCNICLRFYASKLSLKKHMNRSHKDRKKSSRKDGMSTTKLEEENVLPETPTIIPAPNEAMHETSLLMERNEVDDPNVDPVDEIIEQLQNEMAANERESVASNAVTFTINTVADNQVEASHKSPEISSVLTGPQHNEIDSIGDVKPTLLKLVKRFFCDVCPRSFEKHIRLVEHKRLHTGEKPFSCDECGKQFRIRMRLNEHKLRHSKEKRFKCEICELACCTKQDLNLHMRHHTNDRRYQCGTCPKAFVRSSDLKIHVRVHTGEKPFVCDICHKCFRANQNLSVHKKSHMGEASKTYKCEHCEKKFMRNIDRKVHMRSHTGEKPYKCEICQRGYSSKFNVRAHIERDHISANGVGSPPKGKKKPGPKPKALREELEKQKKLIEELQNQLLQQIKTDEKIIPSDEEMMQEHSLEESAVTPDSPLISPSTQVDPIQSAYELLNKLKSSTNIFKPLTIIPSPPPMIEPPSNSFTKAKNDSTNLLPLTITQKLEQPSAASSSTSNTLSCVTTSSSPTNKTTATKVVSQKTSLGIQQVSVTVSMQVENVTPSPTTPEKENAGMLTASAVGSTSVKKERKITSYFTVVGQKADV